MYYADYSDYQHIYGMDRLQEADFFVYAMKASRILDLYTTGVDNVRKLKVAYPTDEETADIVKACFCEVVDTLYQVDKAEKMAETARGYEMTAQGMQGKVVSSRSAGNESISYASGTSSGATTAVDQAISDPLARARLMHDIVTGYLRGLTDANGVNLLYMGSYPRVR